MKKSVSVQTGVANKRTVAAASASREGRRQPGKHHPRLPDDGELSSSLELPELIMKRANKNHK